MASLPRSRAVLRLLLLLGALPFAHSQSTTLAPATAATDGENSRFMGFYIAPDSTERLTVTQGSVWATRGDYAAQCDDPNALESCYIPTACFNSQLSLDDGSVMTCTDGFDCATMTIFQTSPFGGPVATNFNCRAAWVAHTVYRQLVETMVPTRASSTTTTSTSAAPTSSPTSSPTSGAPTPTNTAPLPDNQGNGPKSSNLGAALGGGIGGAAALIGLAVLGVFLYRRNQRAMAAQQAQAPGKDPSYFAPGQGDGAYPGSAPLMSNDSAMYHPGAGAAYQNSPYSNAPVPYTPYGGNYNSADTKSYFSNGAQYPPNPHFPNQFSPSELGDGRGQFSPPRPGGPYVEALQVPGLPAELPGSNFAAEAPPPNPSPNSGATRSAGPVFTSSKMSPMQLLPQDGGAEEESKPADGVSQGGISSSPGSPEPGV